MSDVLTGSVVLNKEVNLEVCDEGFIWLSLPDKWYKLSDRNVAYIGGKSFLVLCASEDTVLKFLYPLDQSEVAKVRDFMAYWGKDRLLEVKNRKWLSFLDFWGFTLSWCADVVPKDSTYQLYSTNYRQYDGDLNIHFDICIGDRFISEGDSYQVYFDLNEGLLNAYLDYYEKDDEYMWWSNISVQFKPELYDIDSYN